MIKRASGMEQTLEGSIALVTGGSRSKGRLTATELAEKGANVIITYQCQAEAAQEVVAEIEAKGRRARAIQSVVSENGPATACAGEVLETRSDWRAGRPTIFSADTWFSREIIPDARDDIAGSTALGRVVLLEDVSGVIGFLCDPKAGFITGAVIKIDGGFKL